MTQVLNDRGPRRKVLTAADAVRERFPQEVGTEMGFEEWQALKATRE